MEKNVAISRLEAVIEVTAPHGNLTIAGAKNVFSHIDLAFKDRKDIKVSRSDETKFFICVLNKDSSFEDAFASTKNGLVLSATGDNSLVKICSQYKHLLEKQSMFFYLGDNVVARINSYSDGLHINRYPLDHPVIWQSRRGHFFVIPV